MNVDKTNELMTELKELGVITIQEALERALESIKEERERMEWLERWGDAQQDIEALEGHGNRMEEYI